MSKLSNCFVNGDVGFTDMKDDSNIFVHYNLNPHNIDNQDDQVFQIVRFFKKDFTNKDVMQLITDYRCTHGIMRMNSADVYTFLNKELGFPYEKYDYRTMTVEKFLIDGYKKIKAKKWIIVKMGRRVELFSVRNGKFYGSHRMNLKDTISGYWIAR